MDDCGEVSEADHRDPSRSIMESSANPPTSVDSDANTAINIVRSVLGANDQCIGNDAHGSYMIHRLTNRLTLASMSL